jgi:V-type H+-transporting ATPase subunit D
MLMGDVMKTASFSLAEAKFSMSGDFTQVVIQSVSKAQIKIRTKRDNVAGENDIDLIRLKNILLFI